MKSWYDDVLALTDEHVLMHARDMLAGFRSAPADAARIPIDPVSRALLLHLGANPDAAEVLLRVASGIGLNDANGDHIAMLYIRGRSDDDDATLRSAKIHLGPVTWEMLDDMKMHVDPVTLVATKMANVHVEDLPEIVRHAAVGRMLAEVVSHPVFDRVPMRIVAVERSWFNVTGWITDDELNRLMG